MGHTHAVFHSVTLGYVLSLLTRDQKALDPAQNWFNKYYSPKVCPWSLIITPQETKKIRFWCQPSPLVPLEQDSKWSWRFPARVYISSHCKERGALGSPTHAAEDLGNIAGSMLAKSIFSYSGAKKLGGKHKCCPPENLVCSLASPQPSSPQDMYSDNSKSA